MGCGLRTSQRSGVKPIPVLDEGSCRRGPWPNPGPLFFLPWREQQGVLAGAALEGPPSPAQGTHPPPLLLLQLVVADLLALQVQFGVLQLSCQPLALLLELLQGPLALVTVCLQIPELAAQTGAGSPVIERPEVLEKVRRRRWISEGETRDEE